MGDEEELKAILSEAFGDSSSDSDGESPCDRRERVEVNEPSDEVVKPLSIFGDTHNWEPVTEINGLWICREFCPPINSFLCYLLLKRFYCSIEFMLRILLDAEGYLAEASHNQAMRFGDLPPWALELSYIVRENVLFSSSFSESIDLTTSENSKEKRLFPSELLWREPLFNQLIVNIYQPGEGIHAHVDLMRFEDGIAIVSLESSCVMHFDRVEEVGENGVASRKIPVLLTPGSMVLMWGEARYLWKHEINRKPGFQIWQGKELKQKRRTSITLRRLCPTE